MNFASSMYLLFSYCTPLLLKVLYIIGVFIQFVCAENLCYPGNDFRSIKLIKLLDSLLYSDIFCLLIRPCLKDESSGV